MGVICVYNRYFLGGKGTKKVGFNCLMGALFAEVG